jgi:EAL domain-containing protein (putative c-di-GMP-specific phosphodiesterase class I)
MAHKLSIRVIAEGVESESQRALLDAAGCDCAQGYLYAHPMPAQEFEAMFSAERRALVA